jgi:hypothetical protein
MSDIYGGYLRRWTIDSSGQKVCNQDAVLISRISPADQEVIQAKNNDIHQAIDDAVVLEAALQAEQPGITASPELLALVRVRKGEPEEGDVDTILERWDYTVEVTERPAATPTHPPVPYAVAEMTIADGEIGGIAQATRLQGAIWWDVGSYWVLFDEEQVDTDYIVIAQVSRGSIDYVKETGWVEITCCDSNSDPIDPDRLSIAIFRIGSE